MSDPTNHDDIIDSRDIIARIEELGDSLRAACDQSYGEAGATDAQFPAWLAKVKSDTDSEHYDELTEWLALKALADEAEGCADWQHGEQLIRDSYFETYAQELADDCGMINSDSTWPNNCIDWEKAARELQMDYTSVDFDGVTYWIRS